MFPPEENVSNMGKGCDPKGVVPDTPFPPHLPQAGAATSANFYKKKGLLPKLRNVN